MAEIKLPILVLGSSSVGKTSLIRRFQNQAFVPDATPETIGVKCTQHKETIQGTRITFSVWDTPGHPRFHSASSMHIPVAKLFIIIYDSTVCDSFTDVPKFIAMVRAQVRDGIIVLVGNKSDRKDRMVSLDDGRRLAEQNSLMFFAVSALTGENVEEMFYRLASIFLDHVLEVSTETREEKKYQRKIISDKEVVSMIINGKGTDECDFDTCRENTIYICAADSCGKMLCRVHSFQHIDTYKDHFVFAKVARVSIEKREEVVNFLRREEEKISELTSKIDEICRQTCEDITKKTREITNMLNERKKKIQNEIENLNRIGYISRNYSASFSIPKVQIDKILAEFNLVEIVELDPNSLLTKAFNLNDGTILLTKLKSLEEDAGKMMIQTYKASDLKNFPFAVMKYEVVNNEISKEIGSCIQTLKETECLIRKSDYFVNIYGWSTAPLFTSIVFEPVKYNLLEFIKRCRSKGMQLSIEKTLEVMRRLSIALITLKDIRIPYKVISPFNIVLTKTQEFKLLYPFNKDESELFLAPEARNMGEFNEEKAIVYSLGIVMAMIVGLIDMSGKNEKMSIEKIMKEVKMQSNSKQLIKEIAKMISINPKNRPELARVVYLSTTIKN
jgi:small GTP-binding protein